MAQVYNEKGSLPDLIYKIGDSEINSLKDIIVFKKTLQEKEKESINIQKIRVSNEIIEIKKEIDEIKSKKNKIFGKFIQKLLQKSRCNFLYNKLSELENNFDYVVEKRVKNDLERLNCIDNIIINNRLFIYGVIGELKTIKELKKLPENFYVINNYKINFHKAIYNKKTDDYIRSAQLDHVVVGPTGLFIIETKNWNNRTIKRKNLFSPAKQIERAGLAMYVLINRAIRNRTINLPESFWGFKKVSPQKIIVLLKGSCNEKIQYINIVPLEKLSFHIQKGENVFSKEEIEGIVNFLLKTPDY